MKNPVIKSICLLFLLIVSYSRICLSQDFNAPDLKFDSAYGDLPLYFIPNQGQMDAGALFYSRTARYTLWLTQTSFFFDQIGSKNSFSKNPKKYFFRDVSRLDFLGANPDSIISPVEETQYKLNYFRGSNSSQWHRDITTSKAVFYRELYDHIDLKVYGNEKQIEYDWIVKPGGNVADIRFCYENMRDVELDKKGNLLVKTDFGTITHARPFCYQELDQEKIEIPGRFKKIGANTYGFYVGEYNKQYDLIIDPVVLVFSTYLGGSIGNAGSSEDFGEGIALDAKGNAYIIGDTYCTDFPTTTGAYQETNAGVRDAFVTKINPLGTALIYTTFIGGYGLDYGNAIAVNWKGVVSMVGSTSSLDFPTKNPLQAEPNGKVDMFLAKLSPQGNNLVYCTYLGGTDYDYAMHLTMHKDNSTYVTGYTYSTDYPTTSDALQEISNGGEQEAFITRISPNGQTIVYSTYLGGINRDRGYGIAVDKKGCAYVTGDTSSYNFPVTTKAFQSGYKGNSDAFVAKLNPQGTDLIYSTFFGGSCYDYSYGIDIDKKGFAYIIGQTGSENLPLKKPFQDKKLGNETAFVTKFSKEGDDIVYSTYLGGKSSDAGRRIAVHRNGFAYVAGITLSKNFPLANPVQDKYSGGIGDAFVTKFSKKGNVLLFSTFLGGSDKDMVRGIAVMNNKSVYVTGYTYSTNFLTKNPLQPVNMGKSDVFITKIK